MIRQEQCDKVCRMPFTPDYKFHGRNSANMKRRNDKLRRLYNLAEKEEKENRR